MVFSADHMNDPARIRAMCEEGFLSEGRRDDLLDFPWHHDIIFHEAGIPPIHTPMQTLQVSTLARNKTLVVATALSPAHHFSLACTEAFVL